MYLSAAVRELLGEPEAITTKCDGDNNGPVALLCALRTVSILLLCMI